MLQKRDQAPKCGSNEEEKKNKENVRIWTDRIKRKCELEIFSVDIAALTKLDIS
jgi:hypothetical protein